MGKHFMFNFSCYFIQNQTILPEVIGKSQEKDCISLFYAIDFLESKKKRTKSAYFFYTLASFGMAAAQTACGEE